MIEELTIFFFLSLVVTAIVFAPCKLSGSYLLFWLSNLVTTSTGIGARLRPLLSGDVFTSASWYGFPRLGTASTGTGAAPSQIVFLLRKLAPGKGTASGCIMCAGVARLLHACHHDTFDMCTRERCFC
jgi:hypothetical protein